MRDKGGAMELTEHNRERRERMRERIEWQGRRPTREALRGENWRSNEMRR